MPLNGDITPVDKQIELSSFNMILNTRTLTLSVMTVASAAVLSSCSLFGGNKSQHSGESSSATGWAYNDPEFGGYEYKSGYEQETGPGLVFIEGGTFVMGRTEQDFTFRNNATPRRVTVTSFYMDECEISNANYREWLFWILHVFEENKNVYKMALPDTLVWRRPLAYNEPYVENYLRHPAYADYPVVGVNWEQANKYCSWRTDRVNEYILYRDQIIELNVNEQKESNNFNTEAYLYGQYDVVDGAKPVQDLANEGQTRRVSQDDGILLPKYELPTEAQWEYAALGLIGNTVDERMSDRKIFPWNSHVVRNPDDADRGRMMANFVRGNGDYMGTAGYLNDKGDITVNVKSYWPNDYGLYCMAGNVNEWVRDVYRPLTLEDADELNPFRGNTFEQLVVDETGAPVEKDSLGQLKRMDETEAMIGDRKNYRTSYAINYLDGDDNSNINESGQWTGKELNTQSMYGGMEISGEDNEIGHKLGNVISDKTRVYKGGGWRDRAYWLSPGTRRSLDQRECRDDIGFRCAMVRVGSPEANGR